MSERLIYYPLEYEPYVRGERVSIPDSLKLETAQQKQECIGYLHNYFEHLHQGGKILEISTKSLQELGVSLSAFNLQFYVFGEGKTYSVENIYQSSKFFENGKNYRDLLYVTPKEAKKDIRLVNSGKVMKYVFEDFEYAFDEVAYLAEPKEAFFEYVYMAALMRNTDLSEELLKYDAFTDIEFDPLIGTNCQARSAAKFVGKRRAGEIKGLSDIQDAINCYIKRN